MKEKGPGTILDPFIMKTPTDFDTPCDRQLLFKLSRIITIETRRCWTKRHFYCLRSFGEIPSHRDHSQPAIPFLT